MKTKITLLILLITAAVTTWSTTPVKMPTTKKQVTTSDRIWGMGLIQREAVMVNFANKQDYYNFIKYGTPFPMDPATLCYNKRTGKRTTWTEYLEQVPTLQRFHNQSWLSQLTYINAMTGGQLCRDFGFTFSDFSGHLDEALEIFMSDRMVYGPAPDEEVIYDGVNIDKIEIHTVLRDAYVNKKAGIYENGWWLHVTGFYPIYDKSAECNNNSNTVWLATHIVKRNDKTPIAVMPTQAPQKAEVKKRYYYEEVVIEEKISKKTNTSLASTKGSNSTVSARTATATATATTSGSGYIGNNVSRNGSASANAVSGSGLISSPGAGVSNSGTVTTSTSSDDEDYGAAGNVQK